MKRTMLQLYLKNCDEAISLYQRAFDATVEAIHRDPENHTIVHAEISAFGQCISFMGRDSEGVFGNTMQFCFHFGEGGESAVKKAYEALGNTAQIERTRTDEFPPSCARKILDVALLRRRILQAQSD